MPVRQYIGARYVPKFFDNNGSSQWVSGISYEPLTIVTWLGNSFTSKIPVPSNIGQPNENPAYWVLTSNYNAQIDDYRAQVEALSDDVTAIDGRVTTAENDIDDLESRLSGFVTPQDFGAVGDGVTDDTAAIQAALNSSAKVIYLPAGDYKTSAPLTISQNGKQIIGLAFNNTRLYAQVGGTFAVSEGTTNVRFKNFMIESVDNENAYAFMLNNASQISIDGVNVLGGSFRQTRSKVLKQEGSSWSTLMINNCIWDCGTITGYAVELINTGNSRGVDAHFTNVFADALLAGADAGVLHNENCRDVNITNSLFRGSSTGRCIYQDGSNPNTINQNSSIQGGSECVRVDTGTYATRDGSENRISNHSTVNRYENGTFLQRRAWEYFTERYISASLYHQNDQDGTLQVNTRGNNAYRTELLLIPANTFSAVVAKLNQIHSNAATGFGCGIVLYNSTTQKMKYFGTCIDATGKFLTVRECSLNAEPEENEQNYKEYFELESDVALRIAKTGNNLAYQIKFDKSTTPVAIWDNQDDYSFDMVGIGILVPSTTAFRLSMTEILDFNIS